MAPSTSIPLNTLVNVVPNVLGAGGNPLGLNAVMFTTDPSVPTGAAQGFPNAAAVGAWFGLSSVEYALALVYFNGFTGATLLPGLLFFMQYNTAAVSGYLRSGSFAGVPLTTLQALSGVLTTVTDGVSSTSLTINLASTSSFTNAAALIQTGIQGGSPASTATVTYDAQRAAFVVHSPTTGATSTEALATGSLAIGLKLTSATGAVLSGGAAIQTPAGGVAALVAATQNWATLMTVFKPSTADMVLFATAINGLGQRYTYVGWDTDAAAATGADASCFAVLTANFNGRVAIWGLADGAIRADGTVVLNDGANAKAAWFCGATASINFDETNGRLDYSWQGQAGLIMDVTDATVAANLQANGYNFFGTYASGDSQFMNFQPGSISGTWIWADGYINQIKINSDLQIATAQWRSAVKAVPFAQRGYNGWRTALLDPIKAHLNFGSIVAGVTLSNAQRQEVNTQVGFNIADTLQSQGWYLNIVAAAPSVRTARGPLQGQFYYTDGGSVRTFNLSSTDVQ